MSDVNPFFSDSGSLDSFLINRSNDNVATELEGEVVLLDLSSNAYIGFDAIGSSIWALLEKPITLLDLIKVLMEKYDVAEEMCRADTMSFLKDLFDKNMLVINVKDNGAQI